MMLLLFGGAFESAEEEEEITGAGNRLVIKPQRVKTQQPRPIVTEEAEKLKTGNYG